MKVLFAVSNDNITTSVVKKYQQKYKEIITNKNVYYFNAIVKELQKDKTYDSIVIEEDLEPISNNNYEAIDKFLTEKLDSISDEAAKPTGEDIPIIFICADRRTVSDKLLIKLFSMGIYNALIGNDRSLDKLCELIAKPRNKKDAKKYYKIETDKAEYQSQRDEIVSEDQIQNILNYYKKIGSNERKCVQAFDSISKQYDSTQLRIIVKFLPMDVKAILEARSPVYQRLMSNGTVLSNGQYSAYTPNNPKKPEKLGLVSKDLNTSSAKPRAVVIPTNMKVKEREENPEDNTGYTSPYGVGQQRMNQTYGQYNQNGYGTQNGMGQYNPYNQMRQNPYGNMYGQMQNSNPYGMGNTMGQQMNNNRMQQRPGYGNYQQNYGMNNNYQQNMNQQGMQTQNGFNQNMNTNIGGYANQNQQNGFNQNNQNQQQNMNNKIQGNDNNPNSIQEQNKPTQQEENNVNETTYINNQAENNISQNQQTENNPVNTMDNYINQNEQHENNIPNTVENSAVQTQQFENNMMQTQQEEIKTVEANKQLINQEENTSILKQEENKELVTNENQELDNVTETVQPVIAQDIQETSNEQEIVEPVKRRRGRPRKIRPVEEVVPQVKKRRGRPRKNPIVDETVKDNDEGENIVNDVPIVEQNQQVQQQVQAQEQIQQTISQPQFQQQVQQQPIVQESAINVENKVEQTQNSLPFNTNSTEPLVEEEQDNDVSLNDLKSNNNDNINNSYTSTVQESENVQNNNEEQQLYRKPDEIKPINLYDLDIDSEDMFGDNQNVNLGVEPINEFKVKEQAETEDTPISQLKQNDNPVVTSYTNENTDLIKQQRKNNDYDITSPIAGSGKIVAFVGTSKNGTSFIVNNVALLLSDSGINTAVVDLTKNKNSYYMFTDNDAGKTKIATESLSKLSEGIVDGLNVKNNLTIFTSLPENHEEDIMNPRTVLESLNSRFDVVLLDCDFKTHEAYFAFANEIFLTQSMDAFTIQPLTKFLSDLKLKNILDENKLRIVINKYVKLKKIDAKMIVGGMSKYNEPSMTLQRDLFDPKKIKVITIPFDNQTYTKYLESIALCQVSVNGYSRDVVDGLEKIKNLVYPLVAGNARGYRNNNNYTNQNNMDMDFNNQRNSQGFSNNMNDTLNKMRSNNF